MLCSTQNRIQTSYPLPSSIISSILPSSLPISVIPINLHISPPSLSLNSHNGDFETAKYKIDDFSSRFDLI